MLEPAPMSFGDALGVLSAHENRDVLVLVSEQESAVESVLVTIRGVLGELEMRDRSPADDIGDMAGVAVFTVAGIDIEIAAPNVKSVGQLLNVLIFEMHGTTLEFRLITDDS